MGFLSLLINQPGVSRVRRNHGLEHATIHILSHRFPKTSMAGHSDTGGFWLLGELETDQVRLAVEHGLARMRAGEHGLAIHPNCGTNFVTSGVLAGLAGAFAMLGAGKRWQNQVERLPLAVTLATVALILARPLGFLMQEHVTTAGNPGGLQIVAIKPTRRGNVRAHRVVTSG